MIRKQAKDSIYVSIDSKLEVKAGNYAFWFFSFHLSFQVVHNTEQKIDRMLENYCIKWNIQNTKKYNSELRRHIELCLWLAYGEDGLLLFSQPKMNSANIHI